MVRLVYLTTALNALTFASAVQHVRKRDSLPSQDKTDESARSLANSTYDVGPYIIDDGQGLGLTFDGIGAISGGGATSKLLYDYPDEVASKILDVLFTPGQGLSLHMLKVEIGGDTDSTQGAEPSHSHFDGDEDYTRGYEWWLMKEAKKRNPDIKLYGLPWGWPGGLDPSASADEEAKDVFKDARRTANYTLNWLMAAKREHNLDIDYVGLWNEMDAPEEYRNALREAVGNSSIGPRTTVLDRIEHYPGSYNEAHSNGCTEYSEEKLRPGELWADEEGSMFDGRSARCLARVLNRNYLSLCKTATIQWHLVSAFYDYLPWPRCGVAVANEPWSGAFEITSPTWAIAHTTQFSKIGWKYAKHGSGVNQLHRGGSMVTRISPDKDHFSIVIEKIDSYTSSCGHGADPDNHPVEEDVEVRLEGAFLEAAMRAGGRLQVWRSNLASSSDYGVNPPEEELFQNLNPLDIEECGASCGIVRLTVRPEEIYTLTTLPIGEKTEVESPPHKPFPFPFWQTFDDEAIGRPGWLWYDQMGAWEIQKSPYDNDDQHGHVLRQVVPVWPNCWGYKCESPSTYFGPTTMKGDLTVQMDVRLEDEGEFNINPIGFNYSALILGSNGKWALGNPPIASGALHFPVNEWHHVAMRLKPDGTQEVTVDGVRLQEKVSLLSHGTNRRSGLNDQCNENTFPMSTKGQFYRSLKTFEAATWEECRKACCMDENLCDVYQFNGETCQFGRAADGGYIRDQSGRWAGATRHDFEGWHLKIRVSRYIHVSVDNFKIFNSTDEIYDFK